MPKDLHELPKLKDSLSYIYVEHAIIEQDNSAIMIIKKEKHLQVVKRLYELRFPKISTDKMDLRQLRGLEGVRVREIYKQMSKIYGIAWKGRDYNFKKWDDSDPLNRALSMANVCLYGLCHAAIVSLGYSPGLGFIHTGKLTSFVYDVADLYKMETTIPAAFETVSKGVDDFLEKNVRIKCRSFFKESKILKRVADDIAYAFNIDADEQNKNAEEVGDLWDGEEDFIAGGVNYSGKE